MYNKIILQLITSCLVCFFGCGCEHKESSENAKVSDKVDPTAIFLPPIDYDTLVNSIKTRRVYPDDFKGLSKNKVFEIHVSYTGNLAMYMKHGTMIIEPVDSSVRINKLNDNLFQCTVIKASDEGIISMYINLKMKSPYILQFLHDKELSKIGSDKSTMVFLISYQVE